MTLFKKLSEGWNNFFKTPQQRLGVPDDFPIKISLGIPEKDYIDQALAASWQYLSATYQGGGKWAVVQKFLDVDEFSSGSGALGEAQEMNTTELINYFDLKSKDAPVKDYVCYDETDFHDARDRLIELSPLQGAAKSRVKKGIKPEE